EGEGSSMGIARAVFSFSVLAAVSLAQTTEVPWKAEAATASSFGWSVAAGNVGGDAASDVIVGAPDYDNGSGSKGAVFVYFGSSSGLGPDGTTANADAVLTLGTGQTGDKFGYSVASGDVNGDGIADVLVGAPFFSNGQSAEGAVFVFYGPVSGADSTPDKT